MPDLSLAAMERLLRNAGAARVSEDAKEALRDMLKEHAREIGERAVLLSAHADRRTVTAADVRLARK